MRIRFAIFTMIGAAAFLLTLVPVRAQDAAAKKTTWDGIYTEAQAMKGEAVYADKCEKCHGVNGSGADAPALAGPDFNTNWDGLTVDQLFDRTRNTMPQDNPQSMSRDETAQLLAYMFSKGMFPAGETELPGSGDALHALMFKASKP